MSRILSITLDSKCKPLPSLWTAQCGRERTNNCHLSGDFPISAHFVKIFSNFFQKTRCFFSQTLVHTRQWKNEDHQDNQKGVLVWHRHLLNSQFCGRILIEHVLQNTIVSSRTLMFKQTSNPIQINGIICLLNLRNILKYFTCWGLQRSVWQVLKHNSC